MRDINMPVGKKNDEAKLFKGVAKINSKFFGLVLGLLFGLSIFVATNWLLIKGGHIDAEGEYVVGPHLQLLGQFFIGYRVSFLGSILGFLYGFAIGTFSGSALGYIYNKIADFRNSKTEIL
jgi:uncharacterized membrane protein required for colicin V production